MSITSPDDRITRYEPVVATTTFAADFPVFDNDDIKVFVDGVERTDFSVSATYVQGISNDARAVFTPGITGVVNVVGARDPRRTSRFINGAPLQIWQQNLALDIVEAEMQEAARDIQRSHRAPYGEVGGVFNAADVGLAQGYAAAASAARNEAVDARDESVDASVIAVAAAAATAWRIFPDQATAAAATIPVTATYIAIASYSPQPRFFKRFATDPGTGDRFQSADGAWWQGLPLPGTSIDYVNAVQRTANASLVAGDLDQAHRWTIPVGTVYTVTLPNPALHLGRILDIGVNSASRGRLAVAYTTNPVDKFAAGGLFLWAGENMTLIARSTQWEVLGGRCIPCTLYATAPGADISMSSGVSVSLTGWQSSLDGTIHTGAEHAINGSGQIVTPRQGFYTLELDVSYAWSVAPTSLYATAHVDSILNRYFSRLSGTNEVLHARHAASFAAGTVLTPSTTATGGTAVGIRSTTFGPPQFKLVESAQW